MNQRIPGWVLFLKPVYLHSMGNELAPTKMQPWVKSLCFLSHPAPNTGASIPRIRVSCFRARTKNSTSLESSIPLARSAAVGSD
jgi:hypothetical protein